MGAKRWMAWIVTLVLLAGVVPASALPTPTEQLKGTIDQILDLLRDSAMDKTERREKIRSLINTRFSFPIMSRSVLAKQWDQGSDEEKRRFIELFSGILENTYMGRIEAYTNEKVDFVAERVKEDKAIVETKIITSTVEIPIEYKTVAKNDEWFVYDVVIEGVSLVRNYRSSYQEIARKDGYPGLLQKMEEKLAEMKAARDQSGG